MSVVKNILLGIWQLPTVIVGGLTIAIIRIFDKNSDFEDYNNVWVVLKTSWPLKKNGEPKKKAGKMFWGLWISFCQLPREEQESYRIGGGSFNFEVKDE